VRGKAKVAKKSKILVKVWLDFGVFLKDEKFG
jgi:hypothetical protein